MARVLVAFSTGEGQTQKIAEEIGREIAEAGHEVEVDEVARRVHAEDFDAVMLGASVHVGHHDGDAVKWARKNLVTHPGLTAFFSVCLTARSEDDESVETFEGYVKDFLAQSEWSPDLATTFAGAIRYSKYGFLKKWIMKKGAEEDGLPTDTSQDYEYTSWASVAHFATDFIKGLR